MLNKKNAAAGMAAALPSSAGGTASFELESRLRYGKRLSPSRQDQSKASPTSSAALSSSSPASSKGPSSQPVKAIDPPPSMRATRSSSALRAILFFDLFTLDSPNHCG